MKAIEEGSICIKTAGRKAGEKVAVVKIIDPNYAEVIGARIKKKRCNIAHLFPTGKKIAVSEKTSQEDVAKKIE